MLQRISFVSILILALVLRIINLGYFGLNTDEKFTLINIHGICIGGYNQQELYDQASFTPQDFYKDRGIQDYYQAVARADFGTHITHNTLMHFWVKAFGKTDTAMRSMSVLFSILLLVVVYWFCKDILESKTTGLWAMFLLAIDPLLVSQAHFARSYSLSFFLLFVSSYLFFRLLKNRNKPTTLAVLYAIVASLSLLNHYLNFVILLAHVIIAAIYLRDTKKWLLLIGAGAFTLAIMAYWMLAGGGQWSLQFLEDKNALHLALSKLNSLENPMRGIVEPSTIQNVSKMAGNMFFDSNVLSFDFMTGFNGIRNIAFYLVFGFSTLLFLHFLPNYWKVILCLSISIALVIGLVFFEGFDKTLPIRGLLFFAAIYALSFAKVERKYLIFLVLGSLLPLAYVIFDAFKSGHTTSLSHRYIGNSIPFIAVVMAVGLNSLVDKFRLYLAIIGGLLAMQVLPIAKELNAIFDDVSARYSFRTEARIPNPYLTTAQKVRSFYAAGDTLILPSYDGNVYTGHLDEKEKALSILDAQYLNIYFEKADPFVQKIDRNESNKVFLKKKNGKIIELFDFQNSKFRY